MTGRPRKIVSGGQTGVDRAALDAAIALRIAHGGWCPRGRLAEDGTIPECYLLTETESAEYRVRTEQNVLESDGTLILCVGQPTGGTELTRQLARQHGKPCLVVDLDRAPALAEVRDWLLSQQVAVLNVAGPRESQKPGIYDRAQDFLEELFAEQ